MGVDTAPPERATRWWWVRHARVTENRGCLYGQSDLSCDTADATAFAALARMLPRDAVWVVSTLRRTHQTAAAIIAAGLPGPAEIPGPEAVAEADFAEQHFGAWQGRSYASLAERSAAEYHRFWLAPAAHRPPGGESFEDLLRRVRPAIARLNRRHAGRDVIAVAHGGTIRAALAEALGLSATAALALQAENLSVTRLDHFAESAEGEAAWRVSFVNRIAA